MSNKAKISLVIFSAVLLSACTMTPQKGKETQPVENNTGTEQSQAFSLRELIALGKNQKCVISTSTTSDDGTKTDTSGTIYISGKKMAQEVMVTSTDKEMPKIDMRMVSDGEYIYTWNTQTKQQGMKFKATDPSDGNIEKGDNSNGGVSMDDKLNVKCSNWLVDNSKFAIPTDVNFTDLSEMMKNIPTMPAGANLPD